MDVLWVFFVIMSMFVCIVADKSSEEKKPRRGSMKNYEGRLTRQLMKRYNPSARPVMNASNTVTVKFAVTLHQIMDMVEKNQTLVTHIWIHEQWRDELLQWNMSDYGGLDMVVLNPDYIWVPDIFIFNNADKGKKGFIQLNESKVMVRSTGRVDWILPLIIKSSCAVNITYFPFDVQQCFLVFGSWIYDSSQVDIQLKWETVDLSAYVDHNELDLINASMRRTMHIYGRDKTKYPQATMHLHLRRKPLYYSYTIVSPTVVLCILTLFSYWLPCDHGGKVGIGLTVFLSLYVLQLAVAEKIPESNSMPLISIFIIMVMTLNAMSLLLATLIINMKQKGDRQYCRQVPWLLLFICRKCIARLTCTKLRMDVELANAPSCDSPETELPPPRPKNMELAPTSTTLCDTPPYFRHRYRKVCTIDNDDSSCEQLPHESIQGASAVEFINRRERSPSVEFYQCSDTESVEVLSAKLSPPSSPSRRKRHLARQTKYEWYFVAESIDKFLFALYLFGMSVTITTLLIIIPSGTSYNM